MKTYERKPDFSSVRGLLLDEFDYMDYQIIAAFRLKKLLNAPDMKPIEPNTSTDEMICNMQTEAIRKDVDGDYYKFLFSSRDMSSNAVIKAQREVRNG